MRYVFCPHGRPSEEVAKIALSQVKRAEKARANLAPEEATHQVRKHCKKMRALVRLTRNENPGSERLYQFENAHYRKIAEVLSGSRDAVSLYDALRKQLSVERFPAASALLEARIDNSDTSQALTEAGELLKQGRQRIKNWDLQKIGNQDLLDGYAYSYRRTYKAMRTAFSEESDARFHTLRKRVKDQWYHSRLLKKHQKNKIGRRCKRLKTLASALGDWRDLRLLSAYVAFAGDKLGGEQIPLLDEIGRKLDSLRKTIDLECSKLFAKPTWERQAKHKKKRKKSNGRRNSKA